MTLVARETGEGGMAVRPPGVAGRFYPDDPGVLAQTVDRHLAGGRGWPMAGAKAIAVPHAGYAFSGPVAGTAWGAVARRGAGIERVVVLAPAHRFGFRGIALPAADALATPLGPMAVDWEAAGRLLNHPAVGLVDRAYDREHALEVQLPFAQRVCPRARLVPLVVGDCGPGPVAEVIARLWGGQETLIVVSTDLSHFHPDGEARVRDRTTCGHVEARRLEALDGSMACGHRPLAGLLQVARQRDLRLTTLDVRTSADTMGNPDRVVGYGAFSAEYGTTARLPAALGAKLRDIAHQALAHLVATGRVPHVALDTFPPPLRALRATFVTLELDGRLRGCIGSLAPQRPLVEDVVVNTAKAAREDPRFAPLTPEEARRVSLSISILSGRRPLPAGNRRQLITELRPDVDGLILRAGDRQALFLPKVWQGLPRADDFITQLLRKAGLPTEPWPAGLQAWRFTAEAIA